MVGLVYNFERQPVRQALRVRLGNVGLGVERRSGESNGDIDFSLEAVGFKIVRQTFPCSFHIILGKRSLFPVDIHRRPDYQVLDRVFASARVKPRFAVECDTISSLITAVEAGRGIAVTMEAFKHVSGKRLVYRPLAGTTEVFSVGIARAKNGNLAPAGEKFCEVLRTLAKATGAGK